MAMYQAGIVHRSWSEASFPIGWYYTCRCPKVQQLKVKIVGPFPDREVARRAASLHNHAEPDHKKG